MSHDPRGADADRDSSNGSPHSRHVTFGSLVELTRRRLLFGVLGRRLASAHDADEAVQIFSAVRETPEGAD